MSKEHDLEGLLKGLKTIREVLSKSAKYTPPSTELIKFNAHGQWKLNKPASTKKGEGPSLSGDYKMQTFGGV